MKETKVKKKKEQCYTTFKKKQHIVQITPLQNNDTYPEGAKARP